MSGSTIAFVVVVVLAVSGVVWGRFGPVWVPRGSFRWSSRPTVWVYPGADAVTVARAVAVWSGRGFPIGPVRAASGSPDDSATLKGIHVYPDDGTLLSLGGAVGAATHLDAAAERALIVLSREFPLTVPLAMHELAHAYDFRHARFPPSGHLMHFDPGRRGLDTRGMKP